MSIDQRTRVPRGRGSRFVLETLFLVALAAALGFADVRRPVIVGVMLAGWLLMAILERAAWQEQPHYGAGFPPRYHVPALDLPPAQPLELVHGYPGARDEAATWIAPAALRAELLAGEWPVATVEQITDEAEGDRWSVVELPPAPLGEVAEVADAQPEPPPEPVAPAQPEPEPEPEPVAQAESEPERVATAVRTARYHADPLADPVRRRRFRRAPVDGNVSLEVPATPGGPRPLPGRSLPSRPT